MTELSLLFLASSFLAGVLMFFAPCTFPLVPPFLAIISGSSSGATARSKNVGVLKNATSFCLGFSLVFILFGYIAGLLGSLLASFQIVVSIVGGLFLIFFGLSTLGLFSRVVFFKGGGLPVPRWLVPGSAWSSFLIGVTFSLGWSPCIGPVMASVLLVSTSSESVYAGIFLLSLFSLGLALPFMLTALFYTRVAPFFLRYTKFTRYVRIVTGLLLCALGVLLLVNQQGLLLSYGTDLFNLLGLDFLYRYY